MRHLLLLLCLLNTSLAANILFVAVFQKSPIIAIQGLAEEVAKPSRGHKVFWAATEEDKHFIAPGVEFVSCGRDPAPHEDYGFTADIMDLFRGEADWAKSCYPHIAKFLESNKIDLIAFDVLTPLGRALADKYKIQSVALVPHLLGLGWLGAEPSYVPVLISPSSVEMSYGARIANFMQARLFSFVLPAARGIFTRGFWTQVGATHEFLPSDNVYGKSRLAIVGTTFGIDVARPLSPLIQVTGPFLPRSSPALADDVSSFIDQYESMVYISLGTNAEWTPSQAQTVVSAVKALSKSSPTTGFLWSIKKYQYDSCLKTLEPLPSNLRIVHFAPQYTVLAHAKVKAFVSHVGYNSLQESLFHGKPILAMPMFGDQVYNAQRCSERGACLIANRDIMTVNDLSSNLATLLKNSSFAKNAERVSVMMKAAGGASRAADLLDMSVKVGYDHLIPPNETQDFIARHDLDVYAALAAIATVLFALLRFCCCRCCRGKKSSKVTLASKKQETAKKNQ